MIKVFFLIRNLAPGGSERQLLTLVRGMDKSRFTPTITTFYETGDSNPWLSGLNGAHVRSLGKRSRWDLRAFWGPLRRAVSADRPHILHGYTDFTNLLCLWAGRSRGAKVVWGIRNSHHDYSQYQHGWNSTVSFYLGALLSARADLMIANSHAGKQHYAAHGYHSTRIIVIPNGIDTDHFRPDPDHGRRVRRQWGVADGELLIGLVGRLDPMKGHPTFLRAAAAIALACPQARFVCVGDGPAAYRARLRALCLSLGLDGKIEWAGHQNDMASVYSAMDVAVSVSLSEGFSNAIGEAMACAVPCIVTPAGDSALIVGPTGSVVPPNDPVAMSQACRHFIELSERERRQLGLQARARIEQEFNVPRLIERTQNAFTSLGFD